MVREVEIQPYTNTSYPLGNIRIVWPSEGDDLEEENVALRNTMSKMGEKLVELEKRIPRENVIILRDISREQAKEGIRQLFKTGRTLYCSDLVKELGIDSRTIVEICDELEANGEITVDQNI